MTKQDITDLIPKVLNADKQQYLFSEGLPKKTVWDYPTTNNLDSKYFYLACQGGYEQEFNSDLSYQLHKYFNEKNPKYFVLREQKYPICPPVFRSGDFRKDLEFDIVAIDNDIVAIDKKKDASISLKHNHLCELPDRFKQAMLQELLCSKRSGFNKHFYVALLSDIIPGKETSLLIKRSYKHYIKNRKEKFEKCMDAHLKFFSTIDPEYHHLIFHNGFVPGAGEKIHLNVFVLEFNFSKRKKIERRKKVKGSDVRVYGVINSG